MVKHFGHGIRILHWCSDQAVTNALAEMDLTAAQGRVMGYIAHRREPPCSRDIEEEFQLSHPTVSGLLSRLEKKDFIEFRPDEHDRRCKRIYVSPKGKECTDRMHRIILDNEAQMVRGFTPEEQEQFRAFLDRAIKNMCGGSCHRNSKEETKE